MKTLRQWDSSVDWYDKNMGEYGDGLNHNIIYPVINKLLGNISDKIILDSGCGSGYFAARIAQKAKQVIATDFSENFVKLCQKKYKEQKNLQFQLHDVTTPMSFANETFDVVISKMVLQYVADINTFAKESFRVLKKEGQLVIVVDHPFHSQFYFAKQLVGKPNPKYPNLKDYFDRGEQTKISLWGKVELTWYPKTVGDYVLPLIKAGFVLKDFQELPEEKKGIRIPRVLLLIFEKRRL